MGNTVIALRSALTLRVLLSWLVRGMTIRVMSVIFFLPRFVHSTGGIVSAGNVRRRVSTALFMVVLL